MLSFDWEPIGHFTANPPVLTDGLCGNCLQSPFDLSDYYVCPQCGTKWAFPDYSPVVYSEWSDADVTGLPVLGSGENRGLGIYR